MTRQREGPARAGSTAGPHELSFDGDNPSHTPQPPPFQVLLAPLRREIAEGCFRLAAFKLIHVADNIAIGDDDAAWPALDCAEYHLGEGASLLREVEGVA